MLPLAQSKTALKIGKETAIEMSPIIMLSEIMMAEIDVVKHALITVKANVILHAALLIYTIELIQMLVVKPESTVHVKIPQLVY